MPEYQPNSQPEIDLLYVLRPVTAFLKKIWLAFVYYLRLLARNIWLFLFIFLLFAIGGRFLDFLIKPGFEVKAVIVSHTLGGNVLSAMVNDIGREPEDIQRHLKLTPAVAATIRKVEGDSMRVRFNKKSMDSVLYYNTSDSVFYGTTVTMVLSDLHYLDSIQTALVTYLGSSPFAMRRTRARRESLLQLKQTLKTKTDHLDSAQNLINSSMVTHRASGGSELLDPLDGYKTSVLYLRQQISIDQELAEMEDIEIVKPFNTPTYFNFPDYLTYYLITLLIGLVMAMLLTPLLGRKPKQVVHAG